jgi:asparagine synthetase B (glutamine-hydrolysing)
MCGIAGVRRFGSEPIHEQTLRLLLCALESRGRDATGVAVKTGKSIRVFKTDKPAWKTVSSPEYKQFISEHLTPETDTVLLHTRAATQGSPFQNQNNHPLFAGTSAVVHNGVISNDAQLFANLQLDRKAEVDSDILRAIIDKHGFDETVADTLDQISGSAAIAAIHPDWPNHLLLGRSGSPLVLATADETLYWASTKEALHHALRPWNQKFGVWFQRNRPDAEFSFMPTDTLYLFDENGLQWHRRFNAVVHYTTPDYSKYHTPVGYAARRSKWLKKCAVCKKKMDLLADECPRCHSKQGDDDVLLHLSAN